MIKRFMRVNDNLFRGGAPNVQDVIDLKKYLGINKIVSLDELIGKKIDRITKLLNIEHVIIPLEANKIAPLAELLSFNLEDLLMKNGPTFVHCKEGKDRTGLVIAMFKCKYMGVSCDKAIQEAKEIGFGIGIPETIIKSYEKIIKMFCKDHLQDKNNADIVENSRPGSPYDLPLLDQVQVESFAPRLDFSRFPYHSEYEKIPIINVGPTANIGAGFSEV